ncbi:MAG: hypothetical protein J6A22_03435 [Bacteroidales bacterium]|nr:hypothetical protein [Bacteroidales bacterium]
MKAGQNFGILFFLLVIAQIVICNYLQLTPYAIPTILPAMILCLPLGIGTIGTMLIAFAAGLSVDWLSEGILGLNAAAILPVAFIKRWVIRMFLGEDILTRNDSFTFRKNGVVKISAILLVSTAVFLLIYTYLDGAGTRPFWFNAVRFTVSLAVNWVLSLVVVNLLMPDDRK